MRHIQTAPDSPGHRRPPGVARITASAVIIAVWLGGAAIGLGLLADYETRVSYSGPAPDRWPPESIIKRRDGGVSLVLFLHPQCPCSSATLTELGRVLAHAPGICSVTVAVYSPSSEPSEWNHSRLRGRAETIPGVRVVDDIDGLEATRFGAVRSGHVVVYDGEGVLRFQGGITASRGHEGDNLGEDCVTAIVHGQRPPAERTPTFGCEILTSASGAPCPLCKEEGTP